MPPVGFELTISAGEWPQTDALDRAAGRPATGAAETSARQHATLKRQTDIHAPGGTFALYRTATGTGREGSNSALTTASEILTYLRFIITSHSTDAV